MGYTRRVTAGGEHPLFRILVFQAVVCRQAGIVQNLRCDGKPLGAVIIRLKMVLRQDQQVDTPVKPAVKGEVSHLWIDVAVWGVVCKDGDGIQRSCGAECCFGSRCCFFGGRCKCIRDIYHKGGIAALVAACFPVVDIDGSAEGKGEDFQIYALAFLQCGGLSLFAVIAFSAGSFLSKKLM